MDTIARDAASERPEDLQQQLEEFRRQNARMARSIRRQRWAFAVVGVMSLVLAVGGPPGFRDAQAQQVPAPPGVQYGPPAHLTKVGRYLIGVHNIRYAFRKQNGNGDVYFSGSDHRLELNADETAQLYATVVR